MSISIETWQHTECRHPKRCHCNCPPCRRAWVLAGQPLIEVPWCQSVHVALAVADRNEQQVEPRASA